VKPIVLASFLVIAFVLPAIAQADRATTLEQRQPLELIFADSVVPQDHHEMMLTTGAWYSRRRPLHDGRLTQKMEWGISDKLQVSAFVNPLGISNSIGTTETGAGDFDLGTRYTWANLGAVLSHIAVAAEAGFPSGDPLKGMGEGAYTFSPSVLLSREFQRGRYQAFSTIGFDLVLARRGLKVATDEPHHEVFANSGFAAHVGRGWAVAEIAVSNNRWSGGDDTQVAFAPSYVWRFRRRTELLFGIPVGLTSSAERIGAVVKFTFELGGGEESK
jgi:hypothetical protein